MGMKVQTPRMEETASGDGGQILRIEGRLMGWRGHCRGDGKQRWEMDPDMEGQSLRDGGSKQH